VNTSDHSSADHDDPAPEIGLGQSPDGAEGGAERFTEGISPKADDAGEDRQPDDQGVSQSFITSPSPSAPARLSGDGGGAGRATGGGGGDVSWHGSARAISLLFPFGLQPQARPGGGCTRGKPSADCTALGGLCLAYIHALRARKPVALTAG
jgi:hypothetical protein